MYKALLFDMDGTILDTEIIYYSHFKKKLEQRGFTLTKEMFLSQIGMGDKEGAQAMTKDHYHSLSPQEYLEIIDRHTLKKIFLAPDTDIAVFSGFHDILEHFKSQLIYAIGTGSHLEVLHHMKKRFKFDDYFTAYVSRDEIPKGKPAPDIYIEAAQRLGVDPTECIVLEDAPAGAISGIAAGCYTIVIKNEWTKHFDFPNAHFICSSFKEAQDHISTLMIKMFLIKDLC